MKIKNLRKYPEKAIKTGVVELKRLNVSPDYFIRIGKLLGIHGKYVDLIIGLFNKEVEYKDLDLSQDEKEILIKNISLLWKKVEKAKKGKRSAGPTKSKKYGGRNFFDGKERRPINKLSNLGTVR